MNIKKVFGVSLLQLVVGAILASVTFVVTYYVDIVAKLTGQSNISESILRQTLGDQISGFTSIGVVNTAVIAIFWGAVGLIAYTTVWAMASAYTSAQNGVKVEKEYTNRGVLKDRLKVPLIRAGIVLLLAILLVVTMKQLWPYWLGLFGQFLSLVTSETGTSLQYLVGAYAGALLNLYLFKVGVSAIRSLQ